MDTGDKVLTVLAAKALCCPLLMLAAGGALGGFGVWLIDGPGKWYLGIGLLLLILWLLLDRRPGGQRSELPEQGEEPEQTQGEVIYLARCESPSTARAVKRTTGGKIEQQNGLPDRRQA